MLMKVQISSIAFFRRKFLVTVFDNFVHYLVKESVRVKSTFLFICNASCLIPIMESLKELGHYGCLAYIGVIKFVVEVAPNVRLHLCLLLLIHYGVLSQHLVPFNLLEGGN
jgi:hypothetical protein